MKRVPIALVAASLAAGAVPQTVASAAPDDIATIGPAVAGQGAWSGERMRGARERLKDVLPGRR